MSPGTRDVIILVMWSKFFKIACVNKLWAQSSPSFLFLRSAAEDLSNKWSTVLIIVRVVFIAHVAHFFMELCIKGPIQPI